MPFTNTVKTTLTAALLLCLSNAALAQESAPGLEAGPLQAGPPVRQGYAYRIAVSLRVENTGAQPSPERGLVFVYTTVTGLQFSCLNQSLPSRSPGAFSLPGLLPGEAQTLNGDLLIPAGWYRGNGWLSVEAAGTRLSEVELLLY